MAGTRISGSDAARSPARICIGDCLCKVPGLLASGAAQTLKDRQALLGQFHPAGLDEQLAEILVRPKVARIELQRLLVLLERLTIVAALPEDEARQAENFSVVGKILAQPFEWRKGLCKPSLLDQLVRQL